MIKASELTPAQRREAHLVMIGTYRRVIDQMIENPPVSVDGLWLNPGNNRDIVRDSLRCWSRNIERCSYMSREEKDFRWGNIQELIALAATIVVDARRSA